MWIKILVFIFIIIIYSYTFPLIIGCNNDVHISNTIKDIDLLLNNNIQCIHIRNFYPINFSNILLKRINNIIDLNIKPWRYSKDEIHDVSIFQKPLSDVFNDLIKPEDYFNQKKWDLYNNIISPIEYFINLSKLNNIYKGQDECIINKFPKYRKYYNKFLDSIVRIYKPNSYNMNGLKHIDIDETGYYNDYSIFSINIYLHVPKDGGYLIFNNLKIKPNKGDLILFNPSYYHSVSQSRIDNRISVQSFILFNKKNKKMYIRV